MEHIPVAGPWITQKEIDYVTDAVSRAWYAQANYYHERFEQALADYLEVEYALALPSCTSAIHLALSALGIGPGDEVIVPEITWIATSAPISYVGATPVFADIDPRTWCLSPESFEACLTPRTKAVIPVDLYGNVASIDSIRTIAGRHNVAIIEDAAQAIGAEYQGVRAGSLGDIGVFSFHGSKTLTTGEGGMLVTNRADIYQRALFLRDHGRHPGGKHFYCTEVGYKYRMSSMQAALGLAQLQRIDELVSRKREIFEWYRQALAGIAGLTVNCELPPNRSAFWMTTVIIDETYGLEKEQLITWLRQQGVDCRPFFYPLSSLPPYADLGQAQQAYRRNPVSYQLSPYGLNLPSALSVNQAQVGYVAKTLQQILLRETV